MADTRRVITTTRATQFGDQFDVEPLRREDGEMPELIVIGVNKGYGFVPVKIALPHQLYVSTVQNILDVYGWAGNDVWILPVYDAVVYGKVIMPCQFVDFDPLHPKEDE